MVKGQENMLSLWENVYETVYKSRSQQKTDVSFKLGNLGKVDKEITKVTIRVWRNHKEQWTDIYLQAKARQWSGY